MWFEQGGSNHMVLFCIYLLYSSFVSAHLLTIRGITSNSPQIKMVHTTMFVFALADGETTSYISEDPIFSGVNGYQTDTTFITNEMFEHMKKSILDVDPGGEESMKYQKYSKEDCEEMSMFCYDFSVCMKKCIGGERCDAVVGIQCIF